MDPAYLAPGLERLYIDEVLHLHSLWRRGPPRNPNPNPNPNPNATLRPATCAAFKKEAKKKKSKSKWEKKWEKKKQQQQSSTAASDQPPAKEVEWPCDPTPEKNAAPATWTELAPLPAVSEPRPPASTEEQARVAADLAQQRGLKACEDFFFSKDGSDDGEDDEDEKNSMDEEEEEEEEEDLKFFLGLFKSDGELMKYYEKNWEKGDFRCLVCGAMGVKKWKRFGNCVGLIQHSNSISKTKKTEAHRAFAKAVCRVLGWDMNRLPSIVLDLGISLGQSLNKTVNLQENMQIEDSSGQEDLSVEVKGLSKEVAENVGTDKVDLMDCAEQATEALPGKDVIGKEEKLPKEIADCGEINDGIK